MTDLITLTVEGDVARLMLNRPDRKNAVSQAMWDVLPALLTTVENDPRVKVMVLGSATPGMFCAGADIEEFAQFAAEPAWREANQAAIRATQVQLARLAKPTIAEVDGACVGAGCGLAIACDLRVASHTARLGITPAKLGLVYPLHDTKLLVDLVGPSRAKWLLYTGRLVSADEALTMGLVDHVVPAEDLRASTLSLAASIAATSQHTVRATKRIVRRILDGQADDDAETVAQFNDAFTGPDHIEGVAAFRAKRAPVFPVR
ncbi:enoyl-CoA hydratase/isomerase family protein [Parapedomonas caeni]|jgi:enoyl-CoA hydratase/carnithine racemase